MSDDTTYICPRHHDSQPKGQPCHACMQEWERLPHPSNMTGEERVQEMHQREVATVAFSLIHGRIEALVGRPVFLHEMGIAWDALVEEARTWDHPHPARAVTMLQDRGIDVVPVIVPVRDEESPIPPCGACGHQSEDLSITGCNSSPIALWTTRSRRRGDG